MKISELKASEIFQLTRKKWDDRNNIVGWLTNNNFKEIGSGRSSVVYSNDTNTVVKVTNFDPAWIKFLEYCEQNKGNPHLPKIISKNNMTNGGIIVIMERLSNMTRMDFNRLWGLNAYLYRNHNYYHYDKKINNVIQNRNKILSHQFARNNPLLAKTLDEVSSLSNDTIFMDIHEGNLMRRGKTVVIIDPLFTINRR